MAKAQQLVRGVAEVVTVLSLRKGDVYKRLVKDYGEKYRIQIGVVTDVMLSDEECAITALEFESSYSSVEPKLVVWGTDTDLKLFDADPTEVREFFAEVVMQADRAVADAQKVLAQKVAVQQSVVQVTSSEQMLSLTSPSTTRALGA